MPRDHRSPRRRLLVSTAVTAALALTVPLLAAGPAGADDRRERDLPTPIAQSPVGGAQVVPDRLLDELVMPAAYPFQPRLKVYPRVEDASQDGDLLPYHAIARRLTQWMKHSDRISTQVIGRSTQGRDLYLVTITAPESKKQVARQTRWRDLIAGDPEAAASDERLAKGYKQPVWFSANIHGNEWEGTDAAMRVIQDLVTAPEREVRDLLRRHRLYFSLTLNPDGRVAGTRATALGLNENRDMITNTTPESQSFVRTVQAVQPLLAADLHGYTDVLQVEPCGPPHGENYEYDLFIPHGYAMARRVEKDVVRADIPGNTYLDLRSGDVVGRNTGHIAIPYRDTPSGWDDFPPIFTAQYAAFHGAITSTVELPLYRTSDTGQSPANGRVNIAVAKRTIESMIGYVDRHGDELLANQIEVFRRGVAGEPKTSLTREGLGGVAGPRGWRRHWDAADDQEPVALPRAYVIPVGAMQRSSADAIRLVRQLQFHGIEVGRLQAPATIGGATYPAGSFVVDMHQPLRGLANSLLDLGSDISRKVPTMYDISAWSLSSLWGATVAKVGATTDAPIGATSPAETDPHGTLEPGTGPLALVPAGVGDVKALNHVLEQGLRASLLPDGAVILPAQARAAAEFATVHFGASFTNATQAQLAALADPATKPLEDLTIAYSGFADDALSLGALGFDDLIAVDSDRIKRRPGLLGRADVLWVGGHLYLGKGYGKVRRALASFVEAGKPVVGHGTAALRVARRLRLVQARVVKGNYYGNGIVDVDTPPSSFLAAGALDHGFIYPAYAFTDLGSRTTAAQTYAVGDPFLAGHWRRSKDGVGPLGVDGLASVVSGQSSTGTRAVVFGTSAVFRTHTRGQMGQAARAILWALPDRG